MKKLLFVLLFTFIGQLAFSQMYIISEKHDGLNGNVASYDSVFVTDPFGVTIAYSIPHIWIDINAHNSEFNQIINNVLNLGYQLLPTQGGSYEIVVTPASYPYGEFAYRTYFLGIPWKSTNLEEVFINYNSINTLVINPNPANEFVNISLSCYIKGENEVVFISEGGFYIS